MAKFAVLSLLAFAVQAWAQSATINTLSSAVTCEPSQITWSGGVGPYFLTVVAPGNPSQVITDLGTQSGTSFTWNVNIPAGTQFVLALKDQTGAQVFSGTSTVTAGSSTSCVGQTTTPATGTNSTATSITSAASSSISSLQSSASSVVNSVTSKVSSSASSISSSVASQTSSSKPNSSNNLIVPGVFTLIASGLALAYLSA